MPYKLSVITPVLNGIRFIEFCILNIIDQNCPGAEHIIIDGGSTDGSVDVIRRSAEQYPHIRWVSEQDQGQSDAMNRGIHMAAGNLISFLNVDDYYEQGALNEAIAIMEDLPEPTLLVGNCNVWDDNGNFQGISKPSKISFLNLLCAKFTKAFPLNPSSYFYHKSLHDKIGLYDVDEHFGMDVHFIFKAVQAAHIVYVDKTWGNLRYFAGTKTYMDVESGQNRIRVNNIIVFYRKQAPFHYRTYSTLYVSLVKMYKLGLKVMDKLKAKLEC